MKKSILFILVYISVAFVGNSFAADVIKITNGEWPPYLSENLKHYGYTSDLVKQIFESKGVTAKYGFFPWKRAYVLAEEGANWNASVIWGHTDERAKAFYFSEPVITLKEVFFHRKDKPFEWKTFKDLKGLRIGVTRGYSYGKELDAMIKNGQIKSDVAATDELNIKKLIAGRIDIFPSQLDVGYSVLNKALPKDKASLITNNSKPYSEKGYSIIISKKYPKGKTMVDLFNAGLAEFKASGKLAEMEKAFHEGAYEK